MANKEFYVKKIGTMELCLVCGYVGDNQCSVFYRNRKNDITIDFGIMPRKLAFETFENEVKKNEK